MTKQKRPDNYFSQIRSMAFCFVAVIFFIFGGVVFFLDNPMGTCVTIKKITFERSYALLACAFGIGVMSYLNSIAEILANVFRYRK